LTDEHPDIARVLTSSSQGHANLMMQVLVAFLQEPPKRRPLAKVAAMGGAVAMAGAMAEVDWRHERTDMMGH